MFKTTLLMLATGALSLAWPQGPGAPHALAQYRLAQPQAQPQYVQQQAQPQYVQQQAQPQAQPQYVQQQAQAQAQPQYVQQQAAPAPAQYAKLRAGPGPVAGGPPRNPAYQPDPEDYDPNPQYQFSFDVKDDEFTNYQNRKEHRDGGKISGSYSVVDSDGFIRTVKYTADPVEGFKAEVTREPTNIVVKLPTPPPPSHAQQPQGLSATQRQLQTHQYLQGSLGVQPPQSQVFASLTQLPRRLPHAGGQAAAPPAPAPAPQPQYAPQPQPQYSAQPQHFAPAPAAPQYAQPEYSPAPQQYQLAAAAAPAPQRAAAPAAAAPRPLKAGAIGFASQQPGGGNVIYQAYDQ